MSKPTRTHARRRAIATFAIAAVALGSAVGLSTIANAAPDSVTIVAPFPPSAVTSNGPFEVVFEVVPAAGFPALTAGVDVVGYPAGSCVDTDFASGDTSGSCFITLPSEGYAIYQVQAWSDDGTGRTTSSTRGIQYGSNAPAAITNPGSGTGIVGSSIAFSGTGPALGTFSLRATPAAGGAEVQVCGGPGANVSATGTWSCLPNFAELREWNVFVRTITVEGTSSDSPPVTIETRPDYTAVTAGIVPGGADVTVTGAAGTNTAVRLYTDFWEGGTYQYGCPAAAGQGDVPTEGPTVNCAFTSLPVGVHLFSSAAYINDVQSSDRGDLIMVPGAPTIDSVDVQADGSTVIEGTRPTPAQPAGILRDGTAITVLGPGDLVVCTDTTDILTAAWSCETGSTVVAPVRAFSTAVGFRDDPAIPGAQVGQYLNGQSALSAAANAGTFVYLTQPSPYSSVNGTSVLFQGIGSPFGNVAVFDAENESTLCTTTVAIDGSWSCSTPPESLVPGIRSVIASLQVGEGQPVNTSEVEFYFGPQLDAPETSFTFTPGGFTVSVSGESFATLDTGLYRVSFVEGEGGEGGGPGYDYDFVDGCPSGSGLAAGPTQTCTFSNLEPGIWNINAGQFPYDEGEGTDYSDPTDDYILIPTTPALNTPAATGSTVTFSGAGDSGAVAIVRTTGGQTVCTAVVAASGVWSCGAPAPSSTTSYRALQQSQGFEAEFGASDRTSYDGLSSLSRVVTLQIGAAPRPTSTPLPTPTPTPTPTPWTLGAITGLDTTTLTPGRSLVLGGDGIPPLSTIVAEIRSTPRVLGSTVADDAGAFTLPVVIPEDMEPGDHTIVLIITPPGAAAAEFAEPVTIVPASPFSDLEADAQADLPGTGIAASGDGSGDDGPTVPRDDPAAPSSMTDSIPTFRDVLSNPVFVASAGGIALAALLLVAFPSELLNSTLSSNTRRFGRWFEAIERVSNNATATFVRVTRTPAVAAGVLVLTTAILFGFVDPNFGADVTSVRLVLALAIALFVITYVSSWISGTIIKRAWDVRSTIELQPAALLFAAIGVVLARILEFSPGFLVGLVIGLELAASTTARHRVASILVKLGVLVGITVIAWIAYSALVLGPSSEPTFFSQLLNDTLASITAEGLTAAFVSLLPLGFLEGRALFQYSKKLWVGAFLVVGTVFALLVLPKSGTEVRDLFTWTLVLVGFAVVTLAIWAWMHFTSTHSSDEDDENVALDRADA